MDKEELHEPKGEQGTWKLQYLKGEENGVPGAYIREKQADGNEAMVFHSFAELQERTRMFVREEERIAQYIEWARSISEPEVAVILQKKISDLPPEGSFYPESLYWEAWNEYWNSPQKMAEFAAMQKIVIGENCCNIPLRLENPLDRVLDRMKGMRNFLRSTFCRLFRKA